MSLFRNRDRYRRAVMDINRILQVAGQDNGAAISLSNYTSTPLSPVRSTDLIQAAEQFEANASALADRSGTGVDASPPIPRWKAWRYALLLLVVPAVLGAILQPSASRASVFRLLFSQLFMLTRLVIASLL